LVVAHPRIAENGRQIPNRIRLTTNEVKTARHLFSAMAKNFKMQEP
jgi:hypothetical protein